MKNSVTQRTQAAFTEKDEHEAHETRPLPAASAQIRIPTQRPKPQLSHFIKRTTEQVTSQWNTEVSRAGELLAQLPLSTDTHPGLASKRIQKFYQKNTSALLKKMIELHEKASKKVACRVMVAKTPEQESIVIRSSAEINYFNLAKPE